MQLAAHIITTGTNSLKMVIISDDLIVFFIIFRIIIIKMRLCDLLSK